MIWYCKFPQKARAEGARDPLFDQIQLDFGPQNLSNPGFSKFWWGDGGWGGPSRLKKILSLGPSFEKNLVPYDTLVKGSFV